MNWLSEVIANEGIKSGAITTELVVSWVISRKWIVSEILPKEIKFEVK